MLIRSRNPLLLLVLGIAALAASGCAMTRGPSRDDAKRASSHLTVGADHMAGGRTALALREFLAAEQLDPKNPQIQYALGEAYLARDKPKDSETHFLRALQLRPDYHDARLSLSGLYVAQGRYQDAITQCQALLDDPTFPQPWRALANRGWAEYKLGHFQEARATLKQALDFEHDYWPAMLSLAILEQGQGHHLEAIGLLDDILELKPGGRVEAEANYRLAEIYISLGKRDQAVGHLTAAVERQPDGEWARRSQEYLKLLH